jgi:hypothetical protein
MQDVVEKVVPFEVSRWGGAYSLRQSGKIETNVGTDNDDLDGKMKSMNLKDEKPHFVRDNYVVPGITDV